MRAIYFEKDVPRVLAVKALRRFWPGVIWSPISPTRVVEMPDPPLPAADWLRVRNIQCGICTTDLNLLFVQAEPAISAAALPGIQRIYLGHEVVGEVVEVGPEVQRFHVGDRVVMEARPFGSPNCLTQHLDPPCKHCAAGHYHYCENGSRGLAPLGGGGGWGDGYIAHETEVWPVPDDLSNDQASLIEPMAVALHGVLRRPPNPGDRVLVIGAGIIGLLTSQAVKVVEPGCHLTVMARHPHQIEAAKRLGADEILSEDDPYADAARITGAQHYRFPMNRGMLLGGFEVVYDCIGSGQTVLDGLRWARAQGTLVMIGTSFNRMTTDLTPVWHQEVDLLGSIAFGTEDWRGRQAHTFDLVIEMLQEGVLTDEGLITHRFPFEAYREAIETATDKRTGSIKVTFDYDA